jgi:hypothetical protein
LLAGRGFAASAGVRLQTLADVLAYAVAEGVTLRLDSTEIQVRRPRANRPAQRAFVSGRKKQAQMIFSREAAVACGRAITVG